MPAGGGGVLSPSRGIVMGEAHRGVVVVSQSLARGWHPASCTCVGICGVLVKRAVGEPSGVPEGRAALLSFLKT